MGWVSVNCKPMHSLEKNYCFRIFSWHSQRREVLWSWGSGTLHVSHMLVVKRSARNILLIPTKRKECSVLKAQYLWRTGCWRPGNANECSTWTSVEFSINGGRAKIWTAHRYNWRWSELGTGADPMKRMSQWTTILHFTWPLANECSTWTSVEFSINGGRAQIWTAHQYNWRWSELGTILWNECPSEPQYSTLPSHSFMFGLIIELWGQFFFGGSGWFWPKKI
jgi:hypothetical protein